MSSIVPEIWALLFHENRALSFPKKSIFSRYKTWGGGGGGGGAALAPKAPPPRSVASVLKSYFWLNANWQPY